MPKISVVVPIYNVEAYLRRCVDSILNQTHSDLQVILVDDGSPDGCPAICDEYAAKDSRVLVLHKPNGGLSSARNTGVEAATGEYILFVDSDDWIKPEMAEILLGLCEKYDADIAECSFENHYEGGSSNQTACTGEVLVQTPEQALGSLMGERDFSSVVWNKLYKAEVAKRVVYPPGKQHEDEFVLHRYCLAAKRIVYIDKPLYNYERGRPDSYMSQGFRLERFDGCEALRERMHLVWERSMSAVEERTNNRYAFVLFYRLGESCREGVEFDNPRVVQTLQNALQDWEHIKTEKRPIEKRYKKAFKVMQKGMPALCKYHAKHMRKFEL